MADLERDLAQLETLLKQLEKEYDQFLSGQLRREPAATDSAVASLIRTYANRSIQSSSMGFKFNSLVARYNSFRTVWTRRLREKEEGRGRPRGARAGPRAVEKPEVPAGGRWPEYLAVDPRRETQGLGQLFEAYRRLRAECGESVEKLKADSFQSSLAAKVEKIKREQGCDAVLIRLVNDQGRPRIIAKPFRRQAAQGAGKS